MRIGIDARVARWNIGSGLENYTSNIIKNLKNIDHKNEYILFIPEKEENYGLFRSEKEEEVEKRNEFWKLMHEPFRKYNTEIDIFHNMSNGIDIPDHKNFKLIITVKDLIPYVMSENIEKLHLEYVLKHTSKVIEEADRIITASNHSKNEISRYFDIPEEKINVIYDAPDEIFKPIEKKISKKLIAKKYGINNKFILFVGGISPRKNIRRLIQAFSMIAHEFKEEYKLVILGEYSENYACLNSLLEKLSLKEKIIFTGFVPKNVLPFFYNGCEVFVYPSLYEGFGLPPLEAAACGVPIITSKVTSMPEVMGESCIYIDPYDVINIAQEIYDTVIDTKLGETLCIKSLAHSKKYSWKRASEETLKVYNSLME
ncbi:glycosyltransferase family 4 protein [Marinisporobacter balticus]|uniref:Glycosyltransferase involved in cell wall biosynthesis n=1 Tax=Marinisporobacter balticus TaxID=2018667 RepID=A0A4R2KZG0_9FIRM|nr:glycosyltransferase family 1 protein [Marinisporobacter balticus]TCO80081.1 glycosyltransferase involved in cell wall biosynthesis [Marinisporobacter balticus]